jgi:hypothetical protein
MIARVHFTWKPFSILLFLPLFQPLDQVVSRNEADQAMIVNLENAWNQAVQLKDGPALQILLGAELVYIESRRQLNGAETPAAKDLHCHL